MDCSKLKPRDLVVLEFRNGNETPGVVIWTGDKVFKVKDLNDNTKNYLFKRKDGRGINTGDKKMYPAKHGIKYIHRQYFQNPSMLVYFLDKIDIGYNPTEFDELYEKENYRKCPLSSI